MVLDALPATLYRSASYADILCGYPTPTAHPATCNTAATPPRFHYHSRFDTFCLRLACGHFASRHVTCGRGCAQFTPDAWRHFAAPTATFTCLAGSPDAAQHHATRYRLPCGQHTAWFTAALTPPRRHLSNGYTRIDHHHARVTAYTVCDI